ncbi:putative AMP-activated kinase, glycogen-binding protein [Dioscorea sansibarensis]
MVLVRFLWPHGCQRASVTGSFVSWEQHYEMLPLENSPGSFQVFLDLPVGFHQIRIDTMHPQVEGFFFLYLKEVTIYLTLSWIIFIFNSFVINFSTGS